MKTVLAITRSMLLGGLVLTCLPDAPAQKTTVHLKFGVYTSDKAVTMYKKFMPILEAIQDGASEELHQEVDIELRIFRTYDEAIQALSSGNVDFVRFGPASYILAKEKNNGVHLLAMEEVKGQRTFKGVVVTTKNSGVKSLADLRGKTFAFGDANSTIGRFLIQNELLKAGLTGRDLAQYRYLGSHDRVFRAVEVGDFAAGSLKINTFKRLNKKGTLVVIKELVNVTKPWIGQANLDPLVKEALAKALLGLKDPEILAKLKVTGFAAATDRDYASIRDAMEGSKKFDPKARAEDANARKRESRRKRDKARTRDK